MIGEDMEINQLRYLVATSDTLSFAKAATKCFTSRQNVARSIQALERELGAKLFARSGNTLTLTEQGEDASSRARAIVEATDELKVAYIPHQDTPCTLKVVFSDNVTSCSSVNFLSMFDDYSVGEFDISEHDCRTCYQMIIDRDADMAVIACMKRSFPKCESIRLCPSPFFALVNSASALALKSILEISDLAEHKLILLSEPSFQYSVLKDKLEQAGLATDNYEIITSTSSMVGLIRRRDAVAIVSDQFYDGAPHGTSVIPFADKDLQWYDYALYRNDSDRRSSIIALASHIKECIRKSILI